MGGITVIKRFRITIIVPFRYPRWPPRRPSWNSSNDISSQTVSRIEPILDGRHHSDKEIQNYYNRSVPISKMTAILKFFKRDLRPNRKSDWAKTWWEASKWHRDSELLKSIQDGRHGGRLEILQTTSPLKPLVGRSQNLMGGITVTQRFRITNIVPFRYPVNSSNDIYSHSVSRIEPKLDGRHESDTDIQKC